MTTSPTERRSRTRGQARRSTAAPDGAPRPARRSWSTRLALHVLQTPQRFHRDQQGTISIISVFAILMLAMLLGFVMNVGQQVDNKVKMQQAADAAANSGGIVLARGMNTLAFTNHLLCDVFALTAFMREARDLHGTPMIPDILNAWDDVGKMFSKSKFTKFALLGPAIREKVPLEQKMVDTYSTWAAASSAAVLPLLEKILGEELIPKYQRALVAATPGLAQLAANQVAREHGMTQQGVVSPERGPMQAMIWCARVAPIGGSTEATHRTLPVVDPALDEVENIEQYRTTSREQRQSLAKHYLDEWNNETVMAFRMIGKMSQFATLWDGFTCGQLEKLLAENEDRNLLFVIRQSGGSMVDKSSSERDAFLASDYSFVTVVYWPKVTDYAPTLMKNPIDGDNVTYSQFMMFIPRNRLIRIWANSGGGLSGPTGIPIGGVPGEFVQLPPIGTPTTPTQGSGGGGQGEWVIGREGRPTGWDLLNQSWRVQLVPATHPSLLAILQTPPSFEGGPQQSQPVKLPNFGNLSPEDLSVLSHH